MLSPWSLRAAPQDVSRSRAAAVSAPAQVTAASESVSQAVGSLFTAASDESASLKKNDGDLEDPPQKILDESDDDAEGDVLLDPTDCCTICFEKAKNAVILKCGHGGCCYNCSIDVCVTSGMCPFCRAPIDQVVTIGLGRFEVDAEGRKVVPVVGPR